MKKYLALLRGINVGGNNKIDMKKLKTAFQGAGFFNVITYINSGNIIFDSQEINIEKIISDIKSALKKYFNLNIKIIIRDNKDMQKLVKKIPESWQNNDKQRTDILFLWDEFDNKKSIDLIKQSEGIDKIIYIKGALAWNLNRDNYKKSSMNKFIGTTLYKNMTARNVNTVRKLAELMR